MVCFVDFGHFEEVQEYLLAAFFVDDVRINFIFFADLGDVLGIDGGRFAENGKVGIVEEVDVVVEADLVLFGGNDVLLGLLDFFEWVIDFGEADGGEFGAFFFVVLL